MKLTKNELRLQQVRLHQLEKYLPTLQLKKMLLQHEVSLAQQIKEQIYQEFVHHKQLVKSYAALLTHLSAHDLFLDVKIVHKTILTENIAGIDLPVFQTVVFEESNHSLLNQPIWLHAAIKGFRNLLILQEKLQISQERKKILEKELKEVSTRVNLFDKILIPRAKDNIRKIKIFLGDQQLAAICQAKVAKLKIIQRESKDI